MDEVRDIQVYAAFMLICIVLVVCSSIVGYKYGDKKAGVYKRFINDSGDNISKPQDVVVHEWSDNITHGYSDDKTDSMGYMFNQHDQLILKNVTNTTALQPGKIYLYRKFNGNSSMLVAHRYGRDCTKGCYGYMFFGNNNIYIDEPVQFKDVVYMLEGINYDN